MSKEEKLQSRFIQLSFLQCLFTRNEYGLLLDALTEEDIDILIRENVYFIRTYSPSSTIELPNVPATSKMKLINFEASYQKLFMPQEVVGILLHEIGHVFNPDKYQMEGEFAADEFAFKRGYGNWVAKGLKTGLDYKLSGFKQAPISERIAKLSSYYL